MATLEWLNGEFLEKCLGEEVAEFSSSAAAPPGNNYGSCVTRVSITLKNKCIKRSLIIKSEVTEGPMVAMVENMPKSCEHYFYYIFIPEAEKITSLEFSPSTFPSPRAYTVVLEDLSEQGFVMVDRVKLLDFDHCKLYMIAASEFHAVSFVVNKNNPKVLEQFTAEEFLKTFEKGLEIFKTLVKYGLECFIESIEGEERFKRVSNVLKGISDCFWEILMDLYKTDGGMKTLVQGDPWITNMMFRYNEQGEVFGIKMIDFQSLRMASPIYDLVVFIWSSANNDVRHSRIHDLLRVYLEHFNKNLTKYGCNEVLTYEVFVDEIEKAAPQVLFIVSSFLPFVLYPEPTDFAALFGVGQTENPFRRIYTENYRKNHLPQVIAQMEKMGVIDNLEKYLKT